jgi:DNA replication protein DnaC
MGECGFGLDSTPPPSDFSFFDPKMQPTVAGQTEAEKLLAMVTEWTQLSADTKPWLLIAGGVGTGKTELLRSAVWQMRLAELRPYYLTAAEFDLRIKDFKKGADDVNRAVYLPPDEWLMRLAAAPMLVIDDLGAGVLDSGFVTTRIERLFSLRYQNRLPTAASTNLTPEGFLSTVGSRVYSRFTDTSVAEIIDLKHCEDIRPLLGVRDW